MSNAQINLASVRRSIEHANGLPNEHYTDSRMHETECRALFHEGWAGLAVAADVPDPGDAIPIQFLDMPLLLIRDRTGQVRVFQNICRHRGMILVEKPRNIAGVIRCPYHSWCYSTEGQLVSTPHVGGPGQNTAPGIDRGSLGLVEVRSHTWRDIVWINLSGSASPFVQANARLIARWAEFDQAMYHGGAESRFALTAACNWKLAVENYCESYHLPWVHPGLNSYSCLEDHYHIEAPGFFSGQGTRVYRQLVAQNGKSFPDFTGLSGKWSKAAEYIALYPNVLLGVHRDHAYAIILLPQGQKNTLEVVHIYYAKRDISEALRRRNAEQWKGVFEEDIFVVEGMQRGRNAPGFDGGRFSPAMDGPTHLFHDWVAQRLMAYRNANPAK